MKIKLYLLLTFLQIQLLAQKPNVVIIYADDIGYGDLSCYQNSNRDRTPNCDRLAKEGIKFTDAHSTAASCTPSRYSLMTGEYAWRRAGTNILPGDASAIIKTGRQTLSTVFKNAGYKTGHVGKWHLGLGNENGPNWNGKIENSPNDLGFDYSFGMAATGDRVPTVYVENSKVVNLDQSDPISVSYSKKIGNEPTGAENPELLQMKHHHGHDNTIINGVGRIGWMTGGQKARWRDQDMADIFTQKAVDFIQNNQKQPFFLYFATHGIHVPRLTHERFHGKSTLGARGDALLEFDETVGKILNLLDQLGIAKNTMVILTSDNGPVINDGYYDQSAESNGFYKPAGMLRGSKGSVFEGGTRIPFLVRYPAKITVPKISNALISQIDLIGSFAGFFNQALDKQSAPDSQNLWFTLVGKKTTSRAMFIEHSHAFAVTDGQWKYIHPTDIELKYYANTQVETGYDQIPQLYNLKNDIAETENLAQKHPLIVEKMRKYLVDTQGKGYVYKR